MTDFAALQTGDRSKVERSRLLSLELETLDAPTYPMIHQEARFLYICQGTGTIEVQGRPVALRPGALLGILPWQISNVTETAGTLRFYTLIYNLQVFTQVFQLFPEADGSRIDFIERVEREPALYCDRAQQKWMLDYFTRLRGEVGLESILEEPKPKPLASLGAMTMLLTLAIRFIRWTGDDAARPPAAVPDLREVLRYMYCHTGEKLTLEGLSRVFYVSEGTLRTFIRRMTGMTFFELLNEMRLGKVASYLLYTNLTIEEISLAVGFWDASHISRTFSAAMGMPINDYRKTYQKLETLFALEDCQLGYTISEYLCRHYQEELSPKRVAERFGVAVSEMNRLLLIQTSRNYEDFLNYVRVNSACSLLLTTERTITDIAIEVGYSNVKTFNRNFFRIKSMTPGDFRKSVSLQPARLGGRGTSGRHGNSETDRGYAL